MPGPTGPTGMQGPTGPTGPTGPYGPTGTCSLNKNRIAFKNWYGGLVTGGLDEPHGIVYDGKYIWVVQRGISTQGVSQYNACDFTFIQTLSGGLYNFSFPNDIAFDGVNLWVTNPGNNSVTAFSATDGSFVMNISGGGYGFNSPQRIIFDGTYLWVANFFVASSVTRFDTMGGSVMNTTGSGNINNPNDLAFDGTNIWISNQSAGFGDNIVIVDQSGTYVNSFNNDGFGGCAGLIFDGTIMWTGGILNDDVVGYSDTAGTVFMSLSGAPYNFNFTSAPFGIRNPLVFDGTRVWVVNGAGTTITAFNVNDGSWANTIGNPTWDFSLGWSLVFDGTFIWSTNYNNNSLYNIYIGNVW
ncbi:hypothetical protein Klosneuvirus_5_6 [Klosneuvirus KNV1]|uniref:Collagen triple helix repeat motif-containing protein n=2 Tax=Klosneuvirus KNV1 TaxID=1977640 RepID=A0A1V0SKV3_9VIRU|nr:hypothetical protein Klosneuvirus_5_6 [Klosneuvirus KNV1]